MTLCPSCGEENDERAKFCWNCATPLKQAAHPSRQVRKTVTVLFCDVTGSTALGERLDPEGTRAIMGRYFAVAKLVLERHGATVEKFIGDAVMAVFGIPLIHEDDALRAVRAAAELRVALGALDRELEAEQGVVLSVRIGVDTGAVVSGHPATGQTLVTGDAVNTAARLEAAAQPAEILIGAATYGLVRDAVLAEPLEPISLKGKTEPVPAYRLIGVIPGADAHTRRLDAPMVGRERELARLRQAYEQAVSDRAPQLFTVLGVAGVGKSRLVTEFLSGVEGGEASILRGRCLPYGEGITYWPIAEIVRRGADIAEDDSGETALLKIRHVVAGMREAEIISSRVASAIGLSTETGPQEELFWAVRRWVESIAAKGPVAILFEDIHWAEPTLLDLIEHLSDWSRDVPLLILCVARPELLDARPTWGGGKLNGTTVFLEPLGQDAVVGLIAHLPGGSTLPDALRSKIVEAADGNPLFVEEMLGMLRDDELLQGEGGGWANEGLASVSVPPSISALLASRLERLGVAERSVAERASVVGRVFDRTAVTELSPESERSTVNASLLSLVRKQLLRPERSDLSGDDAFNFRHILIRDAAYEALPKVDRAELHERFADWLENFSGTRLAEYEAIVGHHLEMAFRYRIELLPSDRRATRLAERAADRLGAAGRRAVQRADLVAASNLLQRAVALVGARAPAGIAMLPMLIEAFIETGQLAEAERMLAQAPPSDASSSTSAHSRLQLQRAWLEFLTHPENYQAAETVAAQTIEALEEAHDEEGLAQAWRMRGMVYWLRVQTADAVSCWRRSLDYAVRSGSAHELMEAIAQLTTAAFFSGMPVADGMELCENLQPHARDHPAVEASILVAQSGLVAMQGRFDSARALRAQAKERLAEFGLELFGAGTAAQIFGMAELFADDPIAAESELRRGYEVLGRMGEESLRSTTAAWLAEALWRMGRQDEAWEFTMISERAGAVDDVATQVSWRSVRAKILAARGHGDEALTLADEAIQQARDAEEFVSSAAALVDQAEVLATVGRGDEAVPVLRRALTLYESKGNVALAERTRQLIGEQLGEQNHRRA